jgi:polyhydroxyalkanoate synthase
LKLDSTEAWAQAAQQFQQSMGESWKNAFQSFQNMDLGGLQPDPAGLAQLPGAPKVQFSPSRLQELQQQYLKDAAELWSQGLNGTPAVKDRRFSAEAWGSNPMAAFSAAAYLLNSRTLMGLAEAVEGDAKTKNRIRFAVEQWMAASAPSNFLAMNADAQKKAIDTRGESIAKGLQNLLNDMKLGHVSMTDESLFEVGRNVATTEGAVVFENALFQLIEYKPLTAKVYEKPFLLVPPCINKYYILDLQPENSVIRYAVAQGHRTFVVSWRNPDQSLAGKTWDDYIEDAAIKAIHTVQDITGSEKINTLGFCVGGTILSTALAVLAERGEKPAASATLLTTLVDFTDTGILDVFIDENFVKYREMQMGKGGLLKGQDLSSTFSFLRPNDLVWNYVVGNYLKGETPPPFDLLYWNSDSTNLPGPFYAWYLRNTYLENNLVKPGRATVCGVKVDLNQCRYPDVHLRLARGSHRADWRLLRLDPGVPGQEAFRHGGLGPHRRRDQPASREEAQPLDARGWPVSEDGRRVDCRRHGGPRQLVDRLVRLAQGPRRQADCGAQGLWQGYEVQGDRARARSLRQGQGLNRIERRASSVPREHPSPTHNAQPQRTTHNA